MTVGQLQAEMSELELAGWVALWALRAEEAKNRGT